MWRLPARAPAFRRCHSGRGQRRACSVRCAVARRCGTRSQRPPQLRSRRATRLSRSRSASTLGCRDRRASTAAIRPRRAFVSGVCLRPSPLAPLCSASRTKQEHVGCMRRGRKGRASPHLCRRPARFLARVSHVSAFWGGAARASRARCASRPCLRSSTKLTARSSWIASRNVARWTASAPFPRASPHRSSRSRSARLLPVPSTSPATRREDRRFRPASRRARLKRTALRCGRPVAATRP